MTDIIRDAVRAGCDADTLSKHCLYPECGCADLSGFARDLQTAARHAAEAEQSRIIEIISKIGAKYSDKKPSVSAAIWEAISAIRAIPIEGETT